MLRVLKYALYLLSWQCRMIQPICSKEKVQRYFECGRKTNFTERLNFVFVTDTLCKSTFSRVFVMLLNIAVKSLLRWRFPSLNNVVIVYWPSSQWGPKNLWKKVINEQFSPKTKCHHWLTFWLMGPTKLMKKKRENKIHTSLEQHDGE